MRDKTIDVLKGLGIILVVWGHSGAPFTHFIYLFHMSLFFMASGYFWSDKSVLSAKTCGEYLVKKLRTLWLPFFIGNGIFSLCNNLFLAIGLYSNDSALLSLENIGESTELNNYLGFGEIAKNILKNMCFASAPQLGSATWFLRTLFIVSIIHMILRYLYTHNKSAKVLYVLFAVIAIIFAQFFSVHDLDFPLNNVYRLDNCCSAYLAFLMGVLIKKYNIMDKLAGYRGVAAIISFAILIGLNFIGDINMSVSKITNVPYFIVASLAGWVLMYNISDILLNFKINKLGEIIGYIGRHTLWILILHYLGFKLVSYLYILIFNEDILYLASYPYIQNVYGLWILYILAGVLVPLLMERVIKTVAKGILLIIRL